MTIRPTVDLIGPARGRTSNPNTVMNAADAAAFHRQHPVVKLAIRDLEEGAGLDHIPSGHYHANTTQTPDGSPAPCSPTTSEPGPHSSPGLNLVGRRGSLTVGVTVPFSRV